MFKHKIKYTDPYCIVKFLSFILFSILFKNNHTIQLSKLLFFLNLSKTKD